MELKEIISAYNDNISSITRKFFRNPSDEEEARQEALIKLWKGIKQRKDGNLKAWINTVVANTCRDFLRVKRNKFDYTEIDALVNINDARQNIENTLISKEEQAKIADEVMRLKPEFRDIIIYYEVQGLTYEEIAIKIGKPVGTVKSRLYSARKTLAERILN